MLGALTNDGKRILTLSLLGGKSIRSKVKAELRLWETSTGKAIGEPVRWIAPNLKGPHAVVKSLVWTPDDKQFLTAIGYRDESAPTVQIWDASTLRPIGEPLAASGDFHVFGRDGKTLLVIGRKQLALWDIGARQRLGTLATPEIAKAAMGQSLRRLASDRPWVACHPNGTQVLYRKDNQAELWDLSTEPPQRKRLLKHSEVVNGLTMSADGKRAATACGSTVIVWDLEAGTALCKVPHVGRIRAMALSPDCRLLATMDDRDVQSVGASPAGPGRLKSLIGVFASRAGHVAQNKDYATVQPRGRRGGRTGPFT